MENVTTTASGAVLPAAPGGEPLPENYEVTIDGFDDGGMLRCVYPGGFVKHHQAETVEELAGKVVNQLRGRYGVTEVVFTTAPKAIEAGERFVVGE